MPPTPTRPVTADGGRARLTVAQYRALRYWVANTGDNPAHGADPRPYPARCGIPLQPVQTSTTQALRTRGWWLSGPRGFVVTDLGRRAIGLPPVYRDKPCPLPECNAVVGERCRATIGGRPGPYTDKVHDARVALHPLIIDGAPARVGVQNSRPEAALTAALDRHLPHLAAQLRSGGLEPRHVGYLIAT